MDQNRKCFLPLIHLEITFHLIAIIIVALNTLNKYEARHTQNVCHSFSTQLNENVWQKNDRKDISFQSSTACHTVWPTHSFIPLFRWPHFNSTAGHKMYKNIKIHPFCEHSVNCEWELFILHIHIHFALLFPTLARYTSSLPACVIIMQLRREIVMTMLSLSRRAIFSTLSNNENVIVKIVFSLITM